MEEDMSLQTVPVTQSTRSIWKPVLKPVIEKIETPIPQQDIFQNEMSKFVYYRTYSRWDEGKKRRETWDETVQRCVNFLKKVSKNKLKKGVNYCNFIKTTFF